jgi:hypothetical protein
MSGNIKWILVILTTIMSIIDSSAQVVRGCRRAGLIYITPPAGLYGWTGGISETCPPNATRTTQYTQFVQNVSGSSSCPVGLLSLGGTGTSVDYRLLYCPLDGWITLLLLPAAFAGILVLRRSQIG